MAYEPQSIYYHDERGCLWPRSEFACHHAKSRKGNHVSIEIAPGLLAREARLVISISMQFETGLNRIARTVVRFDPRLQRLT